MSQASRNARAIALSIGLAANGAHAQEIGWEAYGRDVWGSGDHVVIFHLPR